MSGIVGYHTCHTVDEHREDGVCKSLTITIYAHAIDDIQYVIGDGTIKNGVLMIEGKRYKDISKMVCLAESSFNYQIPEHLWTDKTHHYGIERKQWIEGYQSSSEWEQAWYDLEQKLTVLPRLG